MTRNISKEELEDIKWICWNHIDEILYKYRNRRLITYTDRILLNTELQTLKMIREIEKGNSK